MRPPTARGAEDFVLARWPDLVRTACLVAGDRDTAVDLVVRVLATLLDDWDEVLEEGTPAATARRRLVTALDAADAGRGTTAPRATAGPATVLGDETSRAMLAAYDALPLAARVALTLGHLEGHDAVGVALESGLPVVRVRAELEASVPDLVAAYAEVRPQPPSDGDPTTPLPAEASPPAGTELPDPVRHALDVAFESRLRTVEGAADPVALVATARRAGRRRRTLVGTALAAAVALVAVLVGTRAVGEPAPTPVAAPSGTWGDALTWPARGGLATNPGVRATVRDRWGADTRLLYAGVFGGSRIIVGLAPSTEGAYQVQTLISPNGQPRDGVQGRSYDIGGAPTALALIGVPTAASVPLLVLGRPDVATAQTSATVTYAAGGRALRTWQSWPLEEGVGELTLPVTVGPTSRCCPRCG